MKVTDEILGEGTYGDVRKGYNRKGEVCAIKTFKGDTTVEGIDIGIMRELVYLRSLPTHPNILKLGEIEWCEKTHKIRVEMAFYYRDLNKYIKEDKKRIGLPHDQVRAYSLQLLRALDHCHKNGIFHRDVKPANILLDERKNLVLCDFSLASNFVSKIDHSINVQTLWYRAVEILLGCVQYDVSVDIWSFGCVLGFMLTGSDIFQGNCNYGQLMEIFKMFGTPDTKMWPEMRDFVDYKENWPKFVTTDVAKILFPKEVDQNLLEIFTKSTVYRPKFRATAEQLLNTLEK